jgi:histone deacetylase complex subunit SAP18
MGYADRRGPLYSRPPPQMAGPPMPRPGPPPLPTPEIDREKTCPLLLRVFSKLGSHHKLEEFGKRGEEPAEEVQVYTWADATLRELTDLVQEVKLTPDGLVRSCRSRSCIPTSGART